MVSPMSWESFQGNNSGFQDQSQDQGQPQEPQQESPSSWDQFQTTQTYQGDPDPTADESTWGYLTRIVSSNLARGTEHFIGRAGDIEQFVRKVTPKGSTGLLGDSLIELMGRETFFPTSEEIKQNVTFNLTGDYTKPKTKAEARLQDLSGDIGSMGRGTGTIRRQLVNKLGIPVASNAAKATVEELGFGEDTANWTKMAAMLGLTLLNNVNAPAYAANLMNEGRNGFGPGVTANVPRYENALNRASRPLLQGDPRSALAQQQVAGIRNDIASGQTTMSDLMRRYDAINAAKRDRGLFELRPGDRRAAIANINRVRDSVRSEIEHLGRANPQALESWQNGVNAFSTIHRSNSIANFADRLLTGPYSKAAVSALFGTASYKAPLAMGTAGAASAAAYKSGQVAFRVWNDPNLARYYWEAMSAASRNDAAAFSSNFNKLNKGYEKKYGQEVE